MSDGPKPAVSGYTKNENFILESLRTLRDDVNSNQDRIGQLEGQMKMLLAVGKKEENPSITKQILLLETQQKGQRMELRTKVILAIITVVMTLITTWAALR